MKNMNDLKPCPFCGGKAEFVESRESICWVRCTCCNASGKKWAVSFAKGAVLRARKTVFENWNSRPIEEDLKEKNTEQIARTWRYMQENSELVAEVNRLSAIIGVRF